MKIHLIRPYATDTSPLHTYCPHHTLNPDAGLDRHFWTARERTPWLYDLFQLLRRIDAQAGGRYPLGRAPLPRYEPLRLGQQPSLAFSAANIAAITPYGRRTGLKQVNIVGFGLFGPNGPLPLHLTEYAYQRRQQEKDPNLSAFADIFHHRLIMLFYRAWADAQHCVSFDRVDNRRFDDYAASLIGIGEPAQRDPVLNAQARAFMAGHLTRYPRNSEGLRSIIRHFFSVPVIVRENQFQWLSLPRDARLRLWSAGQGAKLGEPRGLGHATPDRQYRFAIDLGPLSWPQYRQWLTSSGQRPGKLAQLRAWIEHYAGIEYAWEVRLILHHDDYQRYELGRDHALGQCCWLGYNVGHQHREDYCYCDDKPEQEQDQTC